METKTRMRPSRHLLTWTAAAACVALAAPAQAQVAEFRIPAGSLQQVLDSFARQSGKQVIYRLDDVANRHSGGLRGRLTTGGALDVLLAGSGLSARIDQSGAIAILPSRPQTDAGATSAPDRAPLESEAIVVTGTRLHSTNPFNRGAAARSAVPIVSIDGEDLTRTGRNAIGDVLNDLPALRSTLTQANSTRIDTGAGLNMLDLRGLGTNRTLVLQNGRRHIAGATFGSAVDVNTMPVDLIDRVDIVTGGSSAVYGSDAIAGVVNFVLKRDFQGLRVRGQNGISQHGDAGQKFLSATAGTNFDDGRGNLAASVEFAHSSDWYASDRRRYRKMSVYSFVDIDQPGDPNGSDGIPDRILVHDARAFSISNGGTYVVFDSAEKNVPSYLFQPDGSLVRQTGERVGMPSFAGFSGGNGSNLREGKLFALAPDLRRFSFNLLAHWTISGALEPFLEAKFVRVRSFGSSFGSFFSNGAWGPRDAYRTDNPFLTAATRSFIRSTLGLGEGEDSRFYFRRNFEELGPVVQHNRRDTYRVVGGLRGGLGGGWTYEASINAARAKSRTIFTGNVNVQRFLLAIDAVRDPSSGQIVCRSRLYDAAAIPYEGAARPDDALARLPRDVAECVPLNPFGEGNISQAARDYLLEEGTTRTRIKQTVFNVYVAGDSRNWLELRGGPIGIVAGAEYRRESLRDVQDELLQSGLTHATPLPPFAPPRFASKELFGELRIPIFKDRPLFEELTLSGAGRLADYRGSVGTVFAWNAGAEWAPLRDLRFRANRSRAIRAPNAVEAYQPIGQNFSNVAIRDPCTIQRIGSGSASRRANCLADGVPEGFDFAYSSSFPYLAGGNPDLHAERSDSLTIGAVLEPELARGVRLSVDYYDINVKDVIATPGVQTILDACYDAPTLDNPFCALFDRYRGSGRGPGGEVTGQILHNGLRLVPLNYAAWKVRGIDVEASYRGAIGRFGMVNTRLLYTLALQNDSFLDPQDPGAKDQNLLELGNPRHAISWDSELKRGRVTLGYRMHYFSRMSVGPIENIRSVQGRPPQDADAFSTSYFPAASYHDVWLGFSLRPGIDLHLGIDNLTDRLPPPTLTGVDDEGGIYDNVGRFFYVGATARF